MAYCFEMLQSFTPEDTEKQHFYEIAILFIG